MSDRIFGLVLYVAGVFYIIYGFVLLLNDFFHWWPVPVEDKYTRLYGIVGLLAIGVGRIYAERRGSKS